MTDTQWSRADRAAAALRIYHDEMTGHEAFMGDGYGDEGSDEFDEAILSLLTDLKHLLWRVYGADVVLEDLVQTAVDRWAEESDNLPEGGDEDEYESVRGCGCGEADYGAPGHEGHHGT